MDTKIQSKYVKYNDITITGREFSLHQCFFGLTQPLELGVRVKLYKLPASATIKNAWNSTFTPLASIMR